MNWKELQNRWWVRGVIVIFMLGMIALLGQNLLDNVA